MIDPSNFRALLAHLGFVSDQTAVSDVWRKSFGQAGTELVVDVTKQQIHYPEAQGFNVHQRQTCNFAAAENAVVFECVHRLLDKGYQPQHIELEPEWSLGHGGKSGRADILVRDQQGVALLIIECKTAGREFDKAWKDTLEDGAQLFSYVEQEKATQFICLYASEFDPKTQQFKDSQRIVSVKDNEDILKDQPQARSFKTATNAKERFKAWKETYAQEFTETGLFETNIQPYQIGKSKYTLQDDTKPLEAGDIKGKYHRFRTILRKHNVSRRENAFEVLVNLFVCKIVDELENPHDLKFYWKGIAYDNYYDLVDRLQALYKTGMQRFLGQDIVYVSNDDIEQAFWPLQKKRSAVKDEIKRLFRELKFFKGMDFEFIKVFNQVYFDKNAKILIEIIQMWQGLRLTGSAQHQFLGDMFEYFLDNGIKQSEGQFFTPVPICKFIVSALPLEACIQASHAPLKAIDYACGSGHFLTEYAAQLPPLLEKLKQQTDPRAWYSQIYGIEKEDRLAKVAKVSAFMYGFNEIRILDADALVRHPEIAEQGHDVLVANPPFSVEDFLQTVPEQERQRYALLATVSDFGNRNVQCFFLERAQQLLKHGGVMGVIVPSSILSNTDAMHTATRHLLLQYFDVVAIVELGGNTFGKTGTNTVVLFLRRKRQRPEAATHWKQRTHDFFDNWAQELAQAQDPDGSEYGDIDQVRAYCAMLGVDFAAYQTLLSGQPSPALLDTEPFQAYRRAFNDSSEIKKRIASKDFQKQSPESRQQELTQRFTRFVQEKEQTKLYYYLLAADNPTSVLLVKGPSDNKAQQQFLGYEWSGAKGQEGIRYFGGDSVKDISTPLFDPHTRANPHKLSHWIRQNFEGQALHIPTDLQPYITSARLIDLLDFGRVEFDAVLSLVSYKKNNINSKWKFLTLSDECEIITKGTTPTTLGFSFESKGINFIKIESIRDDASLNEKYFSFINEDCHEKLNRSQLKINDILFSIAGALGRTTLINEKVLPANINQALALIRLKKESEFNHSYLHEILQSDFLQNQLNYLKVGIAQPNLSLTQIGELKIPLPPKNIQQDIVAECEAVDQAVSSARTDIDLANKSIEQAFKQATESATREVKLNNPDLFDIFIGKRVLKSEITSDNSGIPVYSANVLQPFGYTKNEFIKDFKSASVLWGIDGDWLVNVIPAHTPFYPTDHCGVLRVKAGANIHPRYLAMALEQEGQRVRFSRSNRAKTEAIKSLKLFIPSWELQEFLAKVADAAFQTIATAQSIIDNAPAQKEAILKKYL